MYDPTSSEDYLCIFNVLLCNSTSMFMIVYVNVYHWFLDFAFHLFINFNSVLLWCSIFRELFMLFIICYKIHNFVYFLLVFCMMFRYFGKNFIFFFIISYVCLCFFVWMYVISSWFCMPFVQKFTCIMFNSSWYFVHPIINFGWIFLESINIFLQNSIEIIMLLNILVYVF